MYPMASDSKHIPSSALVFVVLEHKMLDCSTYHFIGQACDLDLGMQMLSWVNTLALQLLLPLSVVGCAVLIPVNQSGSRVDAATNHSVLMTLTVGNLDKGSSLYW